MTKYWARSHQDLVFLAGTRILMLANPSIIDKNLVPKSINFFSAVIFLIFGHQNPGTGLT
jgi:hypothetical protein